MADTKISNLEALTGADSANDNEFVVVDTDGGLTTKKMVLSELGLAICASSGTKDEDAMGSDSALHLATQQSIKAYVDNGYANIWVPAVAMLPLSTAGAGLGVNEYASNDVMTRYLAFSGTSTEHIAFSVVMPENWNKSTIKAKFYWAPGSSACSENDEVRWQIQGVAISDDEPLDAAYTDAGEAVTDTVTAGKDADLHISSATPAVTITPSADTLDLGDLINFKVFRDHDHADDDMDEDAWLLGVYLQIGVSATISGW